MSLISAMPALLLTGRPKIPPDVAGIILRGLEGAAPKCRIRLGFAYATESGLDSVIGGMGHSHRWNDSEKKWILGIHHGMTEPASIQRIRALPHSRVRLFVGGHRLSSDSLVAGSRFHAKAIAIEQGPKWNITCIHISSANLTGAALGVMARNYEAGIALYPNDLSEESEKTFNEWWEDAWNASVDVSDSTLEKYIRLRDSFFHKNPDVLSDVDPPSMQQIGEASSLWIEAGAMSGGSRNQIEFNRDLAGFFGPVSDSSRNLRIAAEGRIWDDRPLSPKTTTFGVDIWRLSLPTEAQSGFTYPGRVVRFQRRMDGGGLHFDLIVADPRSREHRRWMIDAHRRGYLGRTSGNRVYGFR